MAQKKEKPILIFTKKSGSKLDPWAKKSTLRFMTTLGPSLVSLAQSSWSLLLMALVTGPFLERIASNRLSPREKTNRVATNVSSRISVRKTKMIKVYGF